MARIALISMPWRRPNNAAIGLALLKASAIRAGAEACDVHYLNDRWFNFVFDNVSLPDSLRALRFSEFARVVSELAGVIQAGEWVFSRHLFGDRVPDKVRYLEYFQQGARKNPYAQFASHLVDTAELVEPFFQACDTDTDWMAYEVIGFSCVFYQLSPSLAFADRLRRRGFAGKIVFGGPLCEGPVGAQLIELFPFIDAVFDGEADQSFATFVAAVATGEHLQEVPGVWLRGQNGKGRRSDKDAAVKDMNGLPYPDYSDFFAELKRSGRVRLDDIAFPIEGSRGCWWGERHHCIFCGLNGADMTHRMKTADRIYQELRSLHLEHGLKHFAFTDNIVSPKFTKPLMARLESDPLPITFHAEIKSNLSRRQVSDYRQAGFIYLQPGIESLSSNVLRIMDKGVSALHNIACLKYCKEAKIVAFWNLLYGFPGETEADYAQILEFLPFITHLNPPEVVNAMRLTRFSPSFDRSDTLGFRNRRPARFYSFIFPFDEATLNNLVNTFDFDFDDGLDRASLVSKIEEFVDEWKAQPTPGTLVYDPSGYSHHHPALIDTRFTRKRDIRLLEPLEDCIFRCCDKPTSLKDVWDHVGAALPQAGQTIGEVSAALQSLVDDRFVVREGDLYLSLAMMESRFVPWQALVALEQVATASRLVAAE